MDRTDENLTDGLATVTAEVARTDQKSGLLLTADGVVLAVPAALGSGAPMAAKVLEGLGVAAVVAAMIACLLVARPNLSGSHDKASWLYWKDATEAEVLPELAADRRLPRLISLSKLCHRKMTLLRWATTLTIVAVVALAAAVLITVAG